MRASGRGWAAVLAVAGVLLFAVSGVASATVAPPSNDNRADAAELGPLPAVANGTTVGATVETTEPASGCAQAGPSVWYRFTTGSTTPKRLAVELSANGDLDAVSDVYVRDRSQNVAVDCGRTDHQGGAVFSFEPSPDTTYLVRVAQLSDSVSGTFRLQVFSPPPPATAPGVPLAARGESGALEAVVNISAAYSASLVAGVSYRLNLTSSINGCLRLAIFTPGTVSFDDGTPVAGLRCQGYRLFTPRQTGRYSLLVRASGHAPGSQPYHLQLARASAAETAPGVLIRNDQQVRDVLHGNRIDVLRLYRFDVTSTSNLELDLSTGPDRPFDLQLLDGRGRQIECQCDSTGDQSIVTETRPGRYFAVVQAREFSSGGFSLVRRSRTITHTTVRIDQSRYAEVAPGSPVSIEVFVGPAVDGTTSLEIDRFDPVAGWQFYRQRNLIVSQGSASLSFIPPSTGQWLVHASFLGSLTASPSESRYARVLSAGPLMQ